MAESVRMQASEKLEADSANQLCWTLLGVLDKGSSLAYLVSASTRDSDAGYPETKAELNELGL
jgi:hypothetical protein